MIVEHSELSEERIEYILTELNKKYAAENIVFVTKIPGGIAEYSTIYIGKTEAFDSYGSFAGLAETLDKNNENKTDKAFVMLNAANSNEEIINTISHETDHITGKLNHGGEINCSEGMASDITIKRGGILRTNYSCYVTNTTSADGTIEVVSSGKLSGKVENVTLYGDFHLQSATLNNCTIAGSESVTSISLGENCLAENTVIGVSGCMNVIAKAVAINTVITSGGSMQLNGGRADFYSCNASKVVISSGGVFSNNGKAEDVIISSGGSMIAQYNGMATNTKVCAGGSMILSNTAMHRGSLNIADGAIVSAYEGSVIDFTVANRAVSDGYLINDISLISGVPTYTITVSADQVFGTYKLAQVAENFTGTISIGDGSVNYGTITVNGEIFQYNDVDYLLTQNNGYLELVISDLTAPELSITGNATAWTNKDVTLTAAVSDGTVEYIADCKWNAGNSLTVAENGTYKFRVTDQAGNITEKSVTVDNIDKTAPTLDGALLNAVNGQMVTISWNDAIDNGDVAGYYLTIGKNTYKITATSYMVEFAAGTYSCTLSAFDAAGNVSNVSACEFTVEAGKDIAANAQAVVSWNIDADSFTVELSRNGADDRLSLGIIERTITAYGVTPGSFQ